MVRRSPDDLVIEINAARADPFLIAGAVAASPAVAIAHIIFCNSSFFDPVA
jgi:hypothetical protein